MKALITLILFGLLSGCINTKGPDPIETCRQYCEGEINTIIRIGTDSHDNLYHCSCSNE